MRVSVMVNTLGLCVCVGPGAKAVCRSILAETGSFTDLPLTK